MAHWHWYEENQVVSKSARPKGDAKAANENNSSAEVNDGVDTHDHWHQIRWQGRIALPGEAPVPVTRGSYGMELQSATALWRYASTPPSEKELDSISLEKGLLRISNNVIVSDTILQQRNRASAAIDFGGDSTLPAPPVLTAEQERTLYRKIDHRLMPILSLMYLCSFLDRGNIGNAKLAGLVMQLDLVGNQYNIALVSPFRHFKGSFLANWYPAFNNKTMYFITYCLAEFPANLVLKKFRPSRWLPGITIVWGIVMYDSSQSSALVFVI
ncbi:hypothetical protein EW145_g3693 [Phellinidium pouzarii]|uniref:Major facilitator superfamily (MFS) profile domain-containing protein n=1 Tax=Phellinidium pouzarii TaxID=167371 RepID=A0A4S4L6G0_9AGAM|nr:hypothetical protein EW145_g3693 [Phellinidium pouzarii]